MKAFFYTDKPAFAMFQLLLWSTCFLLVAVAGSSGESQKEDIEAPPRYEWHLLDTTKDVHAHSWETSKPNDQSWFWYIENATDTDTFDLCNGNGLELEIADGQGFWVAHNCSTFDWRPEPFPTIKLAIQGLHRYDMKIRCYVNKRAEIRINGQTFLTSEDMPNKTSLSVHEYHETLERQVKWLSTN